MNHIKKTFLMLIVTSFLVPNSLLAQNKNPEFGAFEAPLPGVGQQTIDQFVKGGGNNPLTKYMNIVIQFVTAGIVVIALISMVIGGYIYMTAGGNADRVSTAKSYISAALLGIALALTAYLILNTISPQFASDLQDPDPLENN